MDLNMVRQDIYWQFAELTNYQYLEPQVNHPNWYLQLLVELEQGKSPQDLHDWLRSNTLPGSRGHAVPSGFVVSFYRSNGIFAVSRTLGTAKRITFVTAWVAKGQIAKLPSSIVKRFKLGLPFRQSDKKPDDFHNLLDDNDKALEWLNSTENPSQDAVYIGIIDDLISKEAIDPRRVKARWDQNSDKKKPRKPYFGYGLLKRTTALLPAVSHGTLVASIAAGAVTPQYRCRQTLQPIAAKVDAASTAPVMTVQLRQDTVVDTSGGALAVNVLDGLHFMLANLPLQAKLAVNISFGTMAGAHDGTSMLEEAMAELVVAMTDRLKIVLPAGNSRKAQAHARFELDQTPHDLIWRVLPDDRTPSYVEIWALPAASFEVIVKSPDGSLSAVCISGGGTVPLMQGANVIGALIPNDSPASSMHKQVILIALAPTRTTGAPQAPHGDWTIQIKNTGPDKATIDCWIERDNASFGQKNKGRQSYFVEPLWPRQPHAQHSGLPPSVICEQGTLNGIATGNHTTVVGGYRIADDALADYSGEGSLPGRSPEGVAPSEESVMRRGIAGVSNSGTSVTRLSGTSAAAPWVTRAIFNAWAGVASSSSPPASRPTSHIAGSPSRAGSTTWR